MRAGSVFLVPVVPPEALLEILHQQAIYVAVGKHQPRIPPPLQLRPREWKRRKTNG